MLFFVCVFFCLLIMFMWHSFGLCVCDKITFILYGITIFFYVPFRWLCVQIFECVAFFLMKCCLWFIYIQPLLLYNYRYIAPRVHGLMMMYTIFLHDVCGFFMWFIFESIFWWNLLFLICCLDNYYLCCLFYHKVLIIIMTIKNYHFYAWI